MINLGQVRVIFFKPGDKGVYDDDFEAWRKPFDETTEDSGEKDTFTEADGPVERTVWRFTQPNMGMHIEFFGEWNQAFPGCLMEHEAHETGLQTLLGEGCLEDIFALAEKRIVSENERVGKAPTEGAAGMVLSSEKEPQPVNECSFVVAFRVKTSFSEPDDFEVEVDLLGEVNLERVSLILTGSV
jgi:hypothetical protein